MNEKTKKLLIIGLAAILVLIGAIEIGIMVIAKLAL